MKHFKVLITGIIVFVVCITAIALVGWMVKITPSWVFQLLVVIAFLYGLGFYTQKYRE